MRILLTNDDGIDAPGLAELEAKSAALGQVTVVAPSRERSGAGHSLTMHEPLRVVAHGDDRWACSGTPVDCVYVALHKLFDGTPDLVISGINKGANLGDDVFYSGTVGAAREAALNGLQALIRSSGSRAALCDSLCSAGKGRTRTHRESAARGRLPEPKCAKYSFGSGQGCARLRPRASPLRSAGRRAR